MVKIKPCPECKGEIRILVNCERGAFAVCQSCEKEFDICGTEQIPLYQGCRIRKVTVDKIKNMWNRRINNVKC